MDAVGVGSALVRDKALLALILETGVRASQIAALDIDDVLDDRSDGLMLRVSGIPTRLSRIITLPVATATLVRGHLLTIKSAPGDVGPLFFATSRHAGTPRRRLSAREVDCLARRCARICGVDYQTLTSSTPALIGARLHAPTAFRRCAEGRPE